MIDGYTAEELSLSAACPDLGSVACLDCTLGEGKLMDDCDFNCCSCVYKWACPCSRVMWENRQAEVECGR